LGNLTEATSSPRLSVVIPTYHRAEALTRLLEGLDKQSFPADEFEVVVILDGPQPATLRVLETASHPYQLRWFVQPHQGEAAARNLGVRQAKAEILLFLDDDIVPSCTLVPAHYAAHQLDPNLVVVGALSVHPESPERFLGETCDFTLPVLIRCSTPGYQPNHLDLLDGNFSVRRQHLLQVQGWDEAFRGFGGMDDFDIGYRLERLGLRFRFEPAAAGFHYYDKSLARLLEDSRTTGRAQVYLARKFPERVRELRFPAIITTTWWRRWIFRFAGLAPEVVFTLLKKVVAPLIRNWQPRINVVFARLSVRFMVGLFLCRGFWEGCREMKVLYRQLRLRVPILAYCCAPRDADPTSTLTVAEIAQHMEWLAHWGYRTISLADFCQWQTYLRPLPPQPVILTFDGLPPGLGRDVVHILKRHNFSATVFVPADSARRSVTDSEGATKPLLGGAEIRELTHLGLDVQGAFEPSGQESRDLGQEVIASARRIQELTGQPVGFFSCSSPYAASVIRSLGEAHGFQGVCSREGGLNDFNQDRFALARIRIPRGLSSSGLRRALRDASQFTRPLHKWGYYFSDKTNPDHRKDDPEFYRLHAQELKLLFGEKAAGRVLEIGCGNGALFPYLGFDSSRYRGVDFSPSMLATFKAAHPEVQLVCAEGSSYVEPGNKYDLILSNSVVHYFDLAMLERHLSCARAMMHPRSLLVCASIPWKIHRSSFFSGCFREGRKVTAARRLISRIERAVMTDPAGRWYEPHEIVKLAERQGLTAEFFGSLTYLERFHAVLRLR